MSTRPLAAVLVAVAALASCTFYIEQLDTHTRRTFSTGAHPRVRVQMFGGSIKVVGGPEEAVRVDLGIKHPVPPPPSAVTAANMDVVMEQDSNGDVLVSLSLKHQLFREKLSCCNRPYVTLHVPTGAVLDVVTGDGDVTITGVTGPRETAATGRITTDGVSTGDEPACELDAEEEPAEDAPREETTGVAAR